jgi:hypothetical protein
MDEFVGPADPDDARDDYDDVVDDCAVVATDSTMGYERDGDGEFGACSPSSIVRNYSRAHEDGHSCAPPATAKRNADTHSHTSNTTLYALYIVVYVTLGCRS